MKKEAADQKEDFEKILKSLHLTMDELRYQITGAISLGKFRQQAGHGKVLKDFFDKNQNNVRRQPSPRPAHLDHARRRRTSPRGGQGRKPPLSRNRSKPRSRRN